jgi:hypothetical protein
LSVRETGGEIEERSRAIAAVKDDTKGEGRAAGTRQ